MVCNAIRHVSVPNLKLCGSMKTELWAKEVGESSVMLCGNISWWAFFSCFLTVLLCIKIISIGLKLNRPCCNIGYCYNPYNPYNPEGTILYESTYPHKDIEFYAPKEEAKLLKHFQFIVVFCHSKGFQRVRSVLKNSVAHKVTRA